MDIYEQKTHRQNIQILRRLTGAQRFQIAMDLTEIWWFRVWEEIRKRFLNSSAEERNWLYLQCLDLCHNRNEDIGLDELMKLLDK